MYAPAKYSNINEDPFEKTVSHFSDRNRNGDVSTGPIVTPNLNSSTPVNKEGISCLTNIVRAAGSSSVTSAKLEGTELANSENVTKEDHLIESTATKNMHYMQV